jgi:RND family efflux transporter MFP subunit
MKRLLPIPFIILAGCANNEPRKTEAAAPPPIAVSTLEIKPVDWAVGYEAPGTVRARTSATISSRIMGYIREIKPQPGDHVSEGQVIVVIDSRDLESGVLQAKAAEQEARNAIPEADNGVAAAKAQLDLSRATFKRMDDLFRKKSISNQEYDEAQARLRTAEAMYQGALAKRLQLDAKIAQARQGVETAGVMRSYAEVRAPFAGVVTEKRAEAGQMATPGAPLLTIEQSGAYRLEAAVEESMLGAIRVGQNVLVVLDIMAQSMAGKVTEIVPAIDPVSRSFLVKISLPGSPLLRSGLFGRLRIPRGSHPALTVPADAVLQRGDIQTVFVADNGVARARLISTGQKQEAKLEVLSGLQPGERIVYPRPAQIADGVRIEVRQ